MGEFLNCSAGVFYLFVYKENSPNTKIRYRNLSSSKVVTLLCKVCMTLVSGKIHNINVTLNSFEKRIKFT